MDSRCNNNTEKKQVGIEWAIQQSLTSKRQVSCLHYSMGKSENIRQIASNGFLIDVELIGVIRMSYLINFYFGGRFLKVYI
jgi:hypothetical protein